MEVHRIDGAADSSPRRTSLFSREAPNTTIRPGDGIQTMEGSVLGEALFVLKDGRLVWGADSGAELTALPESLIRLEKK